MIFGKYRNDRDRAVAQVGLLKFAVVCLSITVVALGITIYMTRHYERTILIPPQFSSEIHITDGQADIAYVRHWTYTVATLAFNYSPANARVQFVDLMTLYSPASYPKANAAWMQLAEDVETAGITSVFYITPNKGMEIDEKKRMVLIHGLRNQYQDRELLSSDKITYEIKYEVAAGRFYINSIQERA